MIVTIPDNLTDLIDSRNEVRAQREYLQRLDHMSPAQLIEIHELNDFQWELEAALAKLQDGFVYIRWDMNAESWSGQRIFRSIHSTLEGAIAAIPESIRKVNMKRPLYAEYVANYTYEAIEKVRLGE